METNQTHVSRATPDVSLTMIESRPCSIQQITHSFSTRSYEVIKLLSDMVRKGQIMVKSTNEGLFVVSGNAPH